MLRNLRSIQDASMPDPDLEQTMDANHSLEEAPSWYGDESESHGGDKIRSALVGSEGGTDLDSMPVRLGSYELGERVGSGGMGVVYSATSPTGDRVAIKVLHPEVVSRHDAVTRFHREARMLSEVQHPNLTRLIELGHDAGYHYLVLEFVDGPSLSRLMGQHGRLTERYALSVIAQVATGLDALHARGVVHRDIKPGNILIRKPEDLTADLKGDAVKLADFGLARSVESSDQSRVTQSGVVIGTPQFMAPEQCVGAASIDSTADVYSMAATLFFMLCGKPPFEANATMGLIDQHRFSMPPRADASNPSVSQAVADVIERALAKKPAERHADAGEFLQDVRALLDGRPIEACKHPVLPSSQPGSVMSFELHCDLQSSPAMLWPHVSNTDRMNRAAGLPPVHYQTETLPTGTRQYGNIGWLGMQMRWREYPYEWIEQRKLSVLRVVESGPIDWLASTVELHPRADGGTHLIHRFDVRARGWLSRWLARNKIGRSTRRQFQRVYRRIDQVLSGDVASQGSDPFEVPFSIEPSRRRAVDAAVSRIRMRADATTGVNADALVLLSELICFGAEQDVARIRPLELVRRWKLPESEVTTALMYATAEGLLQLRWEVHCPICRLPTAHRKSLTDVEARTRCDVCDVDIQTDVAHVIELSFNVHPDYRRGDSRTYCIGAPAHSPHVISQLRLGPNERFRLQLDLCAGEYRINSRQLLGSFALTIEDGCGDSRASLPLGDKRLGGSKTLAAGGQVIELTNGSDRELLVRVEECAQEVGGDGDLYSASRAAALELFRQLFPTELLAVDQPVTAPRMTFLAVRLTPQSIDATQEAVTQATLFGDVQQFLSELRRITGDYQGTMLKTVGNTSICVFSDAAHAVEMTRVKLSSIAPDRWNMNAAIHRGTAILATVNGKLEFFGEAFEQTLRMPENNDDGEVHVDEEILRELGVTELSV
ncbi:MAG: protein kinase [Planctomycetota bacterium]